MFRCCVSFESESQMHPAITLSTFISQFGNDKNLPIKFATCFGFLNSPVGELVDVIEDP